MHSTTQHKEKRKWQTCKSGEKGSSLTQELQKCNFFSVLMWNRKKDQSQILKNRKRKQKKRCVCMYLWILSLNTSAFAVSGWCLQFLHRNNKETNRTAENKNLLLLSDNLYLQKQTHGHDTRSTQLLIKHLNDNVLKYWYFNDLPTKSGLSHWTFRWWHLSLTLFWNYNNL